MATVNFLQGNAIEKLRELPDESVHAVITSSPYWGLRAYGTEPQVWLNGHESCAEHEWNTQMIYKDAPTRTKASEAFSWDNELKKSQRWRENTICVKCGAWRGELGLEPTPEMFVAHLVAIFREVKRVLRDDGVLWVNLGDSYVGGKGASGAADPAHQAERYARGESLTRPAAQANGGAGKLRPTDDLRMLRDIGLKPKDLVGIPWRVAFALQADGWYLRQDIIWHKPNPMPESVRDRCTKAHEYVFMLSKSQKYYFDADAIREPFSCADETSASYRKNGKSDSRKKHSIYCLACDGSGDGIDGENGDDCEVCGGTGRADIGKAKTAVKNDGFWKPSDSGRNKRSVWSVNTHGYKGAHFATFPPDLIEPMILAGTSAKGVCPKCGAGWVRVVEKTGEKYAPPELYGRPRTYQIIGNSEQEKGGGKGSQGFFTNVKRELGWQPSCDCDAGKPIPATILDPFGGAGTTALVSLKHGRNAIYIDLKPEYVEMAKQRIANELGTMGLD